MMYIKKTKYQNLFYKSKLDVLKIHMKREIYLSGRYEQLSMSKKSLSFDYIFIIFTFM